MKKVLLSCSLWCLVGMAVMAQTNTWTGAGGTDNWNTLTNWSMGVPTASHDVVIPTGAMVDVNVAATTKSITVQGTATINIASSLSFINASSAAAASTVNWNSGSFNGGGTFTNNGTINFLTGASKYIYNNTVINNVGLMNFNEGTFYFVDGTINNQEAGTLQLSGTGAISFSGGLTHTLNNEGLIVKNGSNGSVTLSMDLNNNDGTMEVQTGTLVLNSSTKVLTDGTYNVASGAAFDWAGDINCDGVLSGVLNGPINWNNGVLVATTAAFDFTGSTGVLWNSGSLGGGGTLTSENELSLMTGASKYMYDSSTLTNNGDINYVGAGVLYFVDGILNNQLGATIDIQSDGTSFSFSGGSLHLINNYGLLKKTTGPGTTIISTRLDNLDGTISVESGTISLGSETKYLTDGIYNVTSGNTLAWNTTIIPAGTLTGELDGQIAWNQNVTIPLAATVTFNFTGNTGVNWTASSLQGGGTLVNMNELSLIGGVSKYLRDETILNNNGTINHEGGTLYFVNGTINNQLSGVIDLQADGTLLSYSGGLVHTINNYGLLKRTTGTGTAIISNRLNNLDGTISVESGTLSLGSEAKYFTNGVYNVVLNSSLSWDTAIFPTGTLTGQLNGDILWNNDVNIPSDATATFDFSGNAGVKWTADDLNGGGTLVNMNKLSLINGASKYMRDETVLNNNGTLNFEDTGVLYFVDGTLNNQLAGVMDLQADGTLLSFSGGSVHTINNYGLLKRTIGTGDALISTRLNNLDGTISVESGTLSMGSEAKYFTDGVYDVALGTSLVWNTAIFPSGTLTGQLDGEIFWNNDVTLPLGTSATFNFSGDAGVHWTGDDLNGGGTLVNNGDIFMVTGASKYLRDETILDNNGTISYVDAGILYFVNGTINNQATGLIDLTMDGPLLNFSGGTVHILNNFGLLQKSAGSNNTVINVETTNSGSINIMTGELEFNGLLNNTEDGIITGVGTLDLPTAVNFTNDGTFAPGGNPGTLSVLGDFESTTTAVLDVELYGTTPNTQHDVLAITGNGAFDGVVNVTLNTAVNLNDEFVIATTTGTITQCDLEDSTMAEYNGSQYEFSVLCRDENEVVLTVTNISLGIDDMELTESSIAIYPNPVRNVLTLKNKGQAELERASIIDMTGKLLATFDLKSMGMTKGISMENYATGIYVLKIEAGNSAITKQIIKQ